MQERLSYRLTDQLANYLGDALDIHYDGYRHELAVREFADAAMAEFKQAEEQLHTKYKIASDAQKEGMLERSDQLLRELGVINDLIDMLEDFYPKYKVNFNNISQPKPIKDLPRFIDHMKIVHQRIHDDSIVGGIKKLTGLDGWKTNNQAAGELWLQLEEAKERWTREEDSLIPNFKKFCEAEAVKMKKEKDQLLAAMQKKLDAKTAENKPLRAKLDQRKQKLMTDPRIKTIEKQLREVGPLMGKPEGWLHYTPAAKLPAELLMARSLTLAKDLNHYKWPPDSAQTHAEFLDPFARQFSFYNPKVKGFVIPETFLIDYYLILWAETDDGVYEPAGLYRDIVLRQMRFMPLKSTRSFFIDPKGLGKNMKELIKLTKEQGGCGVCSLITQNDDITKTMAQLRQYVTKVRQTLTVTGMIDTTQYNAQPDVKEKIPYTTLVIHDFPYGFSPQALDDLHTLISQANACGFTILVSRCKKDPINESARELFYKCQEGRRLEYRGEKCVYHDGDLDALLRRMEVTPSEEFLAEFNEAYSYRPPVKNGFFDLLPAQYLAQPFNSSAVREIRFPFAVDSQGNVQELVLDSDLKSYGLIIGGTGAGKTSLLHTIINSAAVHYSPQELEMWLIDYKLTSFDFYKRNPLPHLRHIVMDESDVLTYSVVDELRIEYARRQRLFKNAGAKDFGDYRQMGHRLPRLLVLVDEAHLMSQALMDDPNYKQYMQNIIAQARYTGINILLSDQKYSALGGFSGCASDMYVRISLKNAIDQVKDTLGVYNMSSVNEDIAAAIGSMPAAAAGTMIYKHEERNPEDPKTRLVHFDHISSLYAPTDAFRTSIQAVREKAGPGSYPCEIYEGPARLTYSEESIAHYEQRNPMKPNEGQRFYIGSPRGMGKCFSFSLKSEDEGENILLVGGQNELRGPLVANTIRNALRHDYHVVVLVPRASMFYKKNKELVLSLAEEFGDQAEFYTEYPQICRYIGLKANLLKSLEEDEEDGFPESERTFVVCLGADDLYKKMDDDTNTQAMAWAALTQTPAAPEAEAPQKKPAAGKLDMDDLMASIDKAIAKSDALQAKQQPQSRYDSSIQAFRQALGITSMEATETLEELGAPATLPVTCPKSIGSTEGLLGYNATQDLFLLIRDGWKLGFHTLLAVNSANSLKNMNRIKLGGNFNHRFALPMAPEQGGAFLYYTKVLKNMADEGDQISAVYEYMGGNGQRFIPYL